MKILYHQSPRQFRDSIRLSGLIKEHDNTGFGAVFLSLCEPPVSENFDVWEVRVDELILEEDRTTEAPDGDYWCCSYDSIGPDRLRLKEQSTPYMKIKMVN